MTGRRVTTAIRFDADLHAELTVAAAERDVSLNPAGSVTEGRSDG